MIRSRMGTGAAARDPTAVPASGPAAVAAGDTDGSPVRYEPQPESVLTDTEISGTLASMLSSLQTLIARVSRR